MGPQLICAVVIVAWLQPQKKTLKVLEIRGSLDSRYDLEEAPLGLALRDFEDLEELGIPFALLLLESDTTDRNPPKRSFIAGLEGTAFQTLYQQA